MKRVIAGIILIVLSGYFALFVKEYIDRRNPEHAVAKITVTADNQPVAAKLYGYYWHFSFGGDVEVAAPEISEIYELGIPATEVRGGERLEVVFSHTPDYLFINRSNEAYSYSFSAAEDEPYVPFLPGTYVYEVFAGFERGIVSYYFVIVVTG